MKKTLLILLSMVAFMVSQAQDTIKFGDTNYYWAEDFNDFNTIAIAGVSGFLSNGYIKCYSQNPIVVKGMSIVSSGTIVNPTTSDYTDVYMKVFKRRTIISPFWIPYASQKTM